MYKTLLYMVLVWASLSSCKKEPLSPLFADVQYTDLANDTVRLNDLKLIDIDKNGSADLSFHTLFIGDPVNKMDKRQILVSSKPGCYLLNDNLDQSPVLNKGDVIADASPGFNWYEVSVILLAEQITDSNNNIYWQGKWKNAVHRFLPIKIRKNDLHYFGWVELSFDTNSETLLLHKAAISKEPYKAIKIEG